MFDYVNTLEPYEQTFSVLKFLECNPQLKRLRLSLKLSTFDITQIPKLVTNVVSLQLQIRSTPSADVFEPLSVLRKLRHLSISTVSKAEENGFHVDSLFESFVKNDVPIKDLTVSGTFITKSIQIKQFKFLRKLAIEPESGQVLIDIISKLPNLEEIKSEFYNMLRRRSITISDIGRILKSETKLIKLYFVLDYILIDIQEYYSLLALAQHRYKVQILCNTQELLSSIEEEIKHSEWLKIKNIAYASSMRTSFGKFL